jgi:hypothetical protein
LGATTEEKVVGMVVKGDNTGLGLSCVCCCLLLFLAVVVVVVGVGGVVVTEQQKVFWPVCFPKRQSPCNN